MRSADVVRLLAVMCTAAVVGGAAAPAWGTTAQDERKGAALTRAVNAGERSCRSLSPAERERVGEFAMGLRFTSSDEHEAMNARMQTMMGPGGEQQAHRAMGSAWSGCGSGERRGATGEMPGSPGTGMMGGDGWGGAGMMDGTAYGPGMTRAASGAADGGLGAGAVILIGVASALLGGALVAFAAPRLRRAPVARPA